MVDLKMLGTRDLKICKCCLRYFAVSLFLLTAQTVSVSAQQINIPRIEQMPSMPAPYLMRNWKQVALGYDSLVFNFDLTGTYLPLVWLNTSPVNYPDHNSFGLHTVVGTTVPTSAEAINCIPAVISGTLAGIDKSNQNGYNWVLMSEEWFNNRPAQNVYKNHPVDDTGDDWWYETMPNVFFYQLNYLYPGIGDFNNQFTTVADRWLQAVRAMGGSAAPWQVPNMDHRGWYLQTMSPYDDGVHEPEASGAIAWLLYNAYSKTDSLKYRIGAEWAMEFLNSLTTNPSYELQLPYGTCLAARMNAELGTAYDIEKMVNWCFDTGPLRSWGAMVGNWGGYECSGLIGEVNGVNNYAFTMNTMEQVGALIPMVRYDDRFARAIAKWVVNAANASRLSYTNYLPDDHQDSEQWAHQYDSNSYIAHEALREFNGGTSPYATGDAISGGWGLTNLSLYSSSHVGILGGIIDTTNVPMILRLDVLKTDYYRRPAYPTYLYFNPYDSSNVVEIDVGPGDHDLYDAIANTFIQSGLTGKSSFTIEANTAVLLVITPSDGTVTHELDKMLINGVIVDYRSGQVVANHPPRIKALASDRSFVLLGDTARIYCTAMDLDSDTIKFTWHASSGSIVGNSSTVTWAAPDSQASCTITCIVSDGRGGQDTAHVVITSAISINHSPIITSLEARPRKIDLGAASQLTCAAGDSDGDILTYTWMYSQGSIGGSGATVTWGAPTVAGNYFIRCLVEDGRGGQVIDSIGLEVRDFSQNQMGELVAYYPFDGNANDSSGNGNNGMVHGASLVADRKGSPSSAYSFNGTSSYIQVPNSSSLNFQQAISINFWMKIGAFFTREQYPLSHGNWQNRWKVSISNNHLRWTVKTTAGVKDLDSETELVANRWYNVTVLYSGSDFEVYLDGNLDAFSSWSGAILTTTIDLTIGQVLPTSSAYNFQGVLDDIHIYDYALSVHAIDSLAGPTTAVGEMPRKGSPITYELSQNYPNPFNPTTQIRFLIPTAEFVSLKVFSLLGKEVASLVHEKLYPGYYLRAWDASGLPSGVYLCQLSTPTTQLVRKLLLLR